MLGSIGARHKLEAARFELVQCRRNIRIGRQPQILIQQAPHCFVRKRNLQLPGHKSQGLGSAHVETLVFFHQRAPERVFELFAAPQFGRFFGPPAKKSS